MEPLGRGGFLHLNPLFPERTRNRAPKTFTAAKLKNCLVLRGMGYGDYFLGST